MCQNVCSDLHFKEKTKNESDFNSYYTLTVKVWRSFGFVNENNWFEAGPLKNEISLEKLLSWIKNMLRKILELPSHRNLSFKSKVYFFKIISSCSLKFTTNKIKIKFYTHLICKQNNYTKLSPNFHLYSKSSQSLIKFLLLALPCQLEIQLISSKWISSQRSPHRPSCNIADPFLLTSIDFS